MRGNFVIAMILIFPALNAFPNGHLTNKKHKPLLYILPDTTVKANSTDTSSDDEKHRKYEIGLEGANDQTNHGIRSAQPVPYFKPSFTYTAKSGFYVEADDEFIPASKGVTKQQSGFDIFDLNPGWDFDLTDNTTFDVNLTYTYAKLRTPSLVRSNLRWIPETYIDQYIIGELEGKFTIDYDIYAKPPAKSGEPATPNDIVFTPDLLYTFEWDFGKHKQNSLSFIPEVSLDFGTRNFITGYKNLKVSDTAKNTGKAKYYPIESTSFGTLDYNIMLSIELTLGKFSIEPEITYMVPLYNDSSIPSTPYAYGSITLTYTIKSKK